MDKTLVIRSSPHIRSGQSVETIMFHVVLALLPVCLFSVYVFGMAAVAILSTSVVTCLATEYAFGRLTGSGSTIGDWSSAVTGILYGLTLPPGLALWMVAVGGIAAIGVGKMLFGGLGQNPFNPALVGRALLQATFPAAMTRWPAVSSERFSTLPDSSLALPFMKPMYDGISSATPLASWKFDRMATDTSDLFFGTTGGSTGETSAFLILVGGIYLIALRIMSWRIPAAILLTVFATSALLRWMDADRFAGPLFMLCSGGLMLGAVFMATDPVGSPMTPSGCVIYGILIGLLVVVIRNWGGMPEGVMYSILLANAVSPHIDNWVQPRVYGSERRRATHG